MYMYLTERSFGYPISYQADINKPNMGLFSWTRDFFLKLDLYVSFIQLFLKRGNRTPVTPDFYCNDGLIWQLCFDVLIDLIAWCYVIFPLWRHTGFDRFFPYLTAQKKKTWVGKKLTFLIMYKIISS